MDLYQRVDLDKQYAGEYVPLSLTLQDDVTDFHPIARRAIQDKLLPNGLTTLVVIIRPIEGYIHIYLQMRGESLVMIEYAVFNPREEVFQRNRLAYVRAFMMFQQILGDLKLLGSYSSFFPCIRRFARPENAQRLFRYDHPVVWDIDGELARKRRIIILLLHAIAPELQCRLVRLQDPMALFGVQSRDDGIA